MKIFLISNRSELSMFKEGDRVNITLMEGGGIYTIVKINPNNTADVIDKNGRPMPNIKLERFYPIGQTKPSIKPRWHF